MLSPWCLGGCYNHPEPESSDDGCPPPPEEGSAARALWMVITPPRHQQHLPPYRKKLKVFLLFLHGPASLGNGCPRIICYKGRARSLLNMSLDQGSAEFGGGGLELDRSINRHGGRWPVRRARYLENPGCFVLTTRGHGAYTRV